MSEVFEIKPAGNSRRNRPRNRQERNARRTENRSKLAARHQVGRSLRPNEWLQEECAEGKRDALIIRNEWRFKMPEEVQGHSEAACTRAEPLTEEQAVRAVLYRDHMTQAHAFGHAMARVNETIKEASQEDDAAQMFALEVWRDLINGKYEEKGKFAQYLGVRWGYFLGTLTQKLWDERDNFKGIQSESFNRKTGEAHSIKEGYVSEATASDWVHRADRANELLKANVDRKLSQLSLNNRSLLELWLEMDAPTHEELAQELGVSTKTVQRRLKAARREAARLKAKTAKVVSISMGVDLCAASSEDGCTVDLCAAAAPEPEAERMPRMLYTRAEAAYLLSISERSLDYLVSKKEINVRRLGRKILIPHGELVRFCRKDHISVAA